MHFMLLFFFFAGKPDNKTHIYYQIVSYRYCRDKTLQRGPSEAHPDLLHGVPGDRRAQGCTRPALQTHSPQSSSSGVMVATDRPWMRLGYSQVAAACAFPDRA